MNKVLILGGLAAATVYALSQDKEDYTVPPPPPPPPPTTGTTATQTLSTLNGIGRVDNPGTPQASWSRPEWSKWYRAQLAIDPQNANSLLWSEWNNSANEKVKDKFPAVEMLGLSLINWLPLDGPAVEGFNITAHSTPVYDTWSNWWNNVDHWELNHWVLWFDELQAAFGQALAINKWLDAWSYVDNWSSNSVGNYGSIDCDFIDQMMQRGIDIAATGAMTVCAFTNIPYNLVSAGESLSSGVKDTANAISTVAPILVWGGAGLLAYSAYKKIQEDA